MLPARGSDGHMLLLQRVSHAEKHVVATEAESACWVSVPYCDRAGVCPCALEIAAMSALPQMAVHVRIQYLQHSSCILIAVAWALTMGRLLGHTKFAL